MRAASGSPNVNLSNAPVTAVDFSSLASWPGSPRSTGKVDSTGSTSSAHICSCRATSAWYGSFSSMARFRRALSVSSSSPTSFCNAALTLPVCTTPGYSLRSCSSAVIVAATLSTILLAVAKPLFFSVCTPPPVSPGMAPSPHQPTQRSG